MPRREHIDKIRSQDPAYGKCQDCGGWYKVSADGNIRKHHKPECSGSGHTPAERGSAPLRATW